MLGLELSDDAKVERTGEKFGGAARPRGVAKVRCNFGERNKNEITSQHSGMGNLQVCLRDGFVSVEKDVEVDEPRALGEGFLTAHFCLDVAERGKKSLGRQVRPRFENC